MPIQYPKFIRQDWGDREIVQHYLNQGIPYPSPDLPGLTDPISPYGIYVNRKEKCIRIVDATTGQPYPLPNGKFISVNYKHRDPTFKIVQDDASINQWGERETILVSPDRQFDEMFTHLAEAEIRDRAQPVVQIECEVFDDIYQVGDSVHFIIPELGIDKEYTVYEIERTFDAVRRKHYPKDDPGQSVKIKAGAKIITDVRKVLAFIFDKISGTQRAWNTSDLDVESGHAVPVQWVRVYPEAVKIRETVEFNLHTMGNRINTGRINVS